MRLVNLASLEKFTKHVLKTISQLKYKLRQKTEKLLSYEKVSTLDISIIFFSIRLYL